MTRLTSTRINRRSTVFLRPWRPDVCGCQSPLVPSVSPSLDIKKISTLLLDLRARFPVFSVGIFSINKPFLTSNSDVLSLGLLKDQAHGLWTRNVSSSLKSLCLGS